MNSKRELFTLQQAIRDYFLSKNFMDVMTPPAVSNPGMEVHIHPFSLYSVHHKKETNLYLHTSPEFRMKELLSEGFERIFTLTYAFRDEPNSETHRPQFLMLEWYRAQERYEKIMDDCEELFKFCNAYLAKKNISTTSNKVSFTKKTIQEIFNEILGIDILTLLEKEKLYKYIKEHHQDLHLPSYEDMSWDDLYFLLFLNKVEPKFKDYDFLLLYEFPHHLKALSTIKEDDPRVCERFEIYYKGIELCNCFNELTNLHEQIERFDQQEEEKNNLYNYSLPKAQILFDSLKRGLPKSAGIALGVERLLMALTGTDNPFYD